jgi:hypothetical protein
MNLKKQKIAIAPPLQNNQGTVKMIAFHITFKVTVRRLVHFFDFRMAVSENAKKKMATLLISKQRSRRYCRHS